MDVQSLGIRTSLMLTAFDGVTRDEGDCVVVATPTNPTYYWGNYLVFPAPPNEGALDGAGSWSDRFARAFADSPRVRHRAFTWDTIDASEGVAERFGERGYDVERSIVLTVTSAELRAAPHENRRAAPRLLDGDSDFRALEDLLVETRDPSMETGAYRRYVSMQIVRYRRMIEAGIGSWYGAFVDGGLAATMGVFGDEKLARLQHVATHPAHRRRGMCGTLLHSVSVDALARHPGRTLVIVTGTNEPAARVYQSLGYDVTERLVSVDRGPE